MNSVLMQVLTIGSGVAVAALLVCVHIASVMERRRMQRECDMYKRYFEKCYEQKMTKER